MRTLLTIVLSVILLVTAFRLLARVLFGWLAANTRSDIPPATGEKQPPADDIPPGEVEDADFQDLE
ncbi:MAG: hypothetical protein ISR91_02795 [Candidatus Delongbacteria bacterium]|nr:hypothetical protein [bacterium]MBL7033049.1 hypothetical protein [Candidatus Delongbacteria bacterium]